MIDYRQTIRMSLALLSSLLLLALPACSDEEGGGEVLPEEETLYTVTLSLNPSTRGVGTKAGNEPYWDVDDDEILEKYERYIDDCVVAIFQDGNWVKSLSYNINGITNEIDVDNEYASQVPGENATEVGTASVELPAGTYTFYAFANLTSLNIKDTEGTDLIEELVTGASDGKTLTMTDLNKKLVNLGDDISRFNPNATDVTYIPMSSYGEVKAINTDSEMDITLYRMIGKVTISIDNQTSGDLTLNGFTMGNFRRGDIYLIPYGSTADLIGSTQTGVTLNELTGSDQQDSYDPSVPEGGSPKEREIIFDESEKVPQNTDNEPYSYTFYEFETDVNTQSPSVQMWLSTYIEGRDKGKKDLEKFSFMRRNDWLNIPLMIAETDLKISIEGRRMPIGATPEKIEYESNTPFVPAMECTVEHAGVIQFTFDFSMTDFESVELLDKQDQYEGEVQYTKAVVTDNSDQLLCDASSQEVLENNAELDIAINGASGTIQVSTQELTFEGTATIDLTLYVSYERADGVTGTMTIPYTITLTNGKEAKQEEATGGN